MSSTDISAIVRSYIERALRDVPGMKVLLLDADTNRTVSTVLSQSDVLDQEVYLVERIDDEARREALPHLKAVALLRPSHENIARLRRELREPRFGGYHLYFTNRVEDMRLQDLADGDVNELVACVHEVFGDFIALDRHHVSVPLTRPHLGLAPMSWDFGASSDMLNRLTEGLASIILSLRRRFTVRYQRGSETAQRLAQTLHHLTSREQRELFDFGSRSGDASPLLVILDRRDDPVTPLLSQWTYQAMLHEILGIRDNRISLRHVSGLRPELVEAVVDPLQDVFYASNMYANFGDVGMAIKGLVDSAVGESRTFDSLDAMAEFVEALPEMSHQQAVTAKHVALMSELSHAVEQRALMHVSGIEQELASTAANLTAHHEAISETLSNPSISKHDKSRLLALFALRYERDGRTQVGSLFATAANAGVDPGTLGAVRALLKHCSADSRVMDVFSDRTLSSRIATLAKQHLKGVENVYTQHTPPLLAVLERIARGKLSDFDYPRVDGASGGGASPTTGIKTSRLVVVFLVGGTTYEEAKGIAELNAMADRGDGWAAGMRFILAGTGVQNSKTFLADWEEVALMERYATRVGVR